jgi:hypothetical protein
VIGLLKSCYIGDAGQPVRVVIRVRGGLTILVGHRGPPPPRIVGERGRSGIRIGDPCEPVHSIVDKGGLKIQRIRGRRAVPVKKTRTLHREREGLRHPKIQNRSKAGAPGEEMWRTQLAFNAKRRHALPTPYLLGNQLPSLRPHFLASLLSRHPATLLHLRSPLQDALHVALTKFTTLKMFSPGKGVPPLPALRQ